MNFSFGLNNTFCCIDGTLYSYKPILILFTVTAHELLFLIEIDNKYGKCFVKSFVTLPKTSKPSSLRLSVELVCILVLLGTIENSSESINFSLNKI